ncbi:NAD-dependent epimerase/dehydratase family protein, partial [Candidatus Parcubacteria bacterium]|nr:NAD-dependent epimerase/dehydratase family protein [Candidatus Parcubacteria bacterium]
MKQASKKTILVTGATGFLGSQLVKLLTKNNYKIIAIKRRASS